MSSFLQGKFICLWVSVEKDEEDCIIIINILMYAVQCTPAIFNIFSFPGTLVFASCYLSTSFQETLPGSVALFLGQLSGAANRLPSFSSGRVTTCYSQLFPNCIRVFSPSRKIFPGVTGVTTVPTALANSHWIQLYPSSAIPACSAPGYPGRCG